MQCRRAWRLAARQAAAIAVKILNGKASVKSTQFLIFDIWIVGDCNEVFEEDDTVKHGIDANETQGDAKWNNFLK